MNIQTFSIKVLIFSVITLFNLQATADSKLAVHLLSYVAQDYGNAVQAGKIVSDVEYAEQRDFIDEIDHLSKTEKFSEPLTKKVRELRSLVSQKADSKEIQQKANSLKWGVVREFNISTGPLTPPDVNLGEKVYRSACVSCHGVNGLGDGDLGKDLDPRPSNFQDQKRMSAVSPFQAFTTITHGVPGTGMRAFSEFSEHQRWSLALYVHRFHLGTAKAKFTGPTVPKDELYSMSDDELILKYFDGKKDRGAFLSGIWAFCDSQHRESRTYLEGKLTLAREKLAQSIEEYRRGEVASAIRFSLESYLEGIEPIEPLLAESTLRAIEESFGTFRALLRSSKPEEVQAQYEKLLALFGEVTGTQKTQWNSIILAFGIVFREALEAVLVIVLLLSILRKLSSQRGHAWVHAGWISALLIGIGIFFLIQQSLLANMGSVEKLEGYLGLGAVLVLLYVGLWFHGKSHIDQWTAFLRDKIYGHVSTGNMVGLAAISFTAVFREVLETIIFLKVLQLDGHASESIAIGVLLAGSATVLLGFLMTKFYLRLNIGRLISFSTWMILLLAMMILGKSVHALQLSGIIRTTSVLPVSLPALGLFGSLEGLGSQLILALIIVGFMLKSSGAKKS